MEIPPTPPVSIKRTLRNTWKYEPKFPIQCNSFIITTYSLFLIFESKDNIKEFSEPSAAVLQCQDHNIPWGSGSCAQGTEVSDAPRHPFTRRTALLTHEFYTSISIQM